MQLHLVTIHAFRSPQAVPLAAACLKASLEVRSEPVHPVTVDCFDFYCGDSLEEISRTLVAAGPDLVVFPSMPGTVTNAWLLRRNCARWFRH